MKKNHYKTIFISDIHLWNPKNQPLKLVKFLKSISFENLIIVWDFIDYRQLDLFWKWWEQETETLNYINDLSNNWVKIVYIQWNHDRKLICWNKIHINNMSIRRDLYYKTLKWKLYYITHGDCMDGINNNWNNLWKIWSFTFWLLLKLESLRNKNTFNDSYTSIAEKFEEQIKKIRMPDKKINNKIIKFSKNLKCDWIIIWHFHIARHYKLNWIDYFNLWDQLRNYSVVIEDLEWNLNLIKYTK